MNDARSATDPHLALGGFLRGAATLQAIYAAVRLRVPELLATGAKTASDLAGETGCDPEALHRLLRALSTIGCFASREDGAFALTPLSDILRADHPRSARARLLAAGAPYAVEAWSRLDQSLLMGGSAFVAAHGMSKWEYYAAHPVAADTFDEAMLGRTRARIPSLLSAYDFSPYPRIVDVGGGRGHVLAAILAAHPKAEGTLFDSLSVVRGAGPVLAAAGVESRVAISGGDFRTAVPGGHDLYVLSDILHDWPDEDALGILRACVAGMNAGAKLLVVEVVMPERDVSPLIAWLDLLMMVEFGGGRQRTLPELSELLARAGLAAPRVIPAGDVSIVETSRC